MEGVDKEKVQRIVYEMSKGSKYFENEERKDAYLKQKIETMRAHCAKLTAEDICHFQKVFLKYKFLHLYLYSMWLDLSEIQVYSIMRLTKLVFCLFN